jgi:hypothetical protein
MNDGFAIIRGVLDCREVDAIACDLAAEAAPRRVLHLQYAAAATFEDGLRLHAA